MSPCIGNGDTSIHKAASPSLLFWGAVPSKLKSNYRPFIGSVYYTPTLGTVANSMQFQHNRQKMSVSSAGGSTQPSLWLRRGRLVLGALISVVVIFWLARTFDLQQILLALRDVNYAWVLVGLLMVLLTLWTRVLRWQALLDSKQVTASGALPPLVMGQLLNLIVSSRSIPIESKP